MIPRESALLPAGHAKPPERLWTVPNLLTLARLPLAGLVWIDPSNGPFILAILAVAGVTDFLDGRLARLGRAPGERPSGPGVWLDPVCDKVFIISVVAALGISHSDPFILFPMILAREIVLALGWGVLILSGGWRGIGSLDYRADFYGKATTVAQFLSIALLLAIPSFLLPAAAGAGALGAFSGIRYLCRSVSRLASQSPIHRERTA